MTTLSTVPAYAIPNAEARVTFTLTESGSNYVRVWVTKAPSGSELAEKLTAAAQNRFIVYQGDGGVNQPWRFTADKGGKYTFVAQEYMRGSGYGGGYEGDPDGALSETKKGDEYELALYIGQKTTSRLGVTPDNATLVVWCWADYVRATILSVHGEASPRVESDSPTPRAKAAMESEGVATAIAALIDQPYSTIGGSIAAITLEMVTDLNAHNALGATTHNAADTSNVIPRELGSAPTPQTLPDFINDALRKMRQHRLNDHGGDPLTATAPGTGSAAYHQISAVPKADLANMPLYQSVGDLSEAYAALADIWRAHEGHRVSVLVHGTADSSTPLAALPPLLEVHRRYLDVCASLAPTAAPAQSNMVNTLVNSFGFEEAP